MTNSLYSASLDDQQRKDAKSQNSNGNPIRLQSKILAIHPDPKNSNSIYVATSSGVVRRVVLEVCDPVLPTRRERLLSDPFLRRVRRQHYTKDQLRH